jgi:PPK2 family polyphosphate:nucleotide phosphotransferase
MPNTHKLEQTRLDVSLPTRPFQLSTLPTQGKQFHPDREQAEAEFKALRREFIELQTRLYAEGKQKLLIVFQAMDAGGKDGAIRNVFRGVNPQGARVHPFKVPSKEELAHDFLWRIHKVVPAQGMIGVFNRSHYEDVLVVRVHDIVPESVWRPRYEQINEFEKLLADTGTTILKFFLHISPEEQKERFRARLDDPGKHWKFSLEDLEKRKFWGDYMAAYEEMLHQCTTPYAPWYVIPADQKWYRNLTITRTIVHTLKQMDPQYPPPADDLSGVVIN